jgi:hypothetical protein
MSKRKPALMKNIPISLLLKDAQDALEMGFGLERKYKIISLILKDNTILIEYIPEVRNRTAIYADICCIISFIYSFLVDDLDDIPVYNIGVQAKVDGKPFIFIISPKASAKEISKGNAIYWLKNSIIEEPFNYLRKIIFLVEGPTEFAAYPILFNAMGYRIDAHNIDIICFAEYNLRTVLAILHHNNERFFLSCDKDKSNEMADLRRRGCLGSNYHILERGEFEDYADSDSLANILELLNPGIGITQDFIELRRKTGKATSKIISEYYNSTNQVNKLPGKPKVGMEIANYWAEKGIPTEFQVIIKGVLNVT